MIAAIVPFGVHAWYALRGFFAHDDFLITYRAATEGLDLAYLFQDYNEHLSPGVFALAWVVTEVAPLNFAVAMLPLLAMQAATSVVLWLLLVRWFGPRWPLLLPFVVFTCSPVVLTPTMWWAYGVQLLPTMLAMVSALFAHTGYLLDGRTSQAVAGLLWAGVGLLFYEKAGLIPLVLFGITVLLAPAGNRTPIAWAVRSHLRLWLAYGALLAAYGGLYLAVTTGSSQAPVAEDGLPRLAWRMIVDSLLVPSLGLPVSAPDGEGVPQLTMPPLAFEVLAVVVAVGVLVAGWWRGRRRAIYAWALLGTYLVIDVGLVAAKRLALLGPAIGMDMRYIADAVLVMVLCGAFAFLTPRGQHATSPVPTRRVRLGAPVLVVVVLAVAIGATASTAQLAPDMRFSTSRDYVTTARAALAARGDIVLYDTPVPRDVMTPWFGSDGVTSRVLGQFENSPRFDEPDDEIYLLDRAGRPTEVTGIVDGVPGMPGPVDECGYAVRDRWSVIPLTSTVDGRRLARLRYFTARGGPATVIAGGTRIRVDLDKGENRLYIPIDGVVGRIEIKRNTRVAAVCVTDVVVGRPVI
ncbi:hypothetical protein [Haloechinothrix salitolerans]|uniref:Uncharacterized protein n=1 Tax=Haloechinothrix salitolerans TaxID=926830 RepID=A0ABW2BS67_9PSEU